MKVFISWSGQLSRRLAEAFRDWLPGVIQAVEPFFSPDDIVKGDRWGVAVAAKLNECKVGIFCITRDNVAAPWLVFEAGAISKHLESSKVCTLYFDLAPTDVTGPLTQFQGATFGRQEVLKVLQTINEGLDSNRLKGNVLDQVFEKWWPDLEARVATILTESSSALPDKELRSDRDILHEILSIARYLKVPRSRGHRLVAARVVYPVFTQMRELIRGIDESELSSTETVANLGDALTRLFTHLKEEHGLALGVRARRFQRNIIAELDGLKQAGRSPEPDGAADDPPAFD